MERETRRISTLVLATVLSPLGLVCFGGLAGCDSGEMPQPDTETGGLSRETLTGAPESEPLAIPAEAPESPADSDAPQENDLDSTGQQSSLPDAEVLAERIVMDEPPARESLAVRTVIALPRGGPYMSPSGQPIFIPTSRRFGFSSTASPYLLADAKLYDVRTGEAVGPVPVDENGGLPQLWALAPNGRYFVFLSPQNRRHPEMVVVDCSTGQPVGVLNCLEGVAPGTMNTDYGINHLCFTKFNHLFAVATFDRHSGLFLWDLAKGKLLRKFPAAKLDGKSALMALSDDGRYFVARVKLELILFDMVEGKVVANMASPQSIQQNADHYGLRSLAFSPDGSALAGYYTDDRPARAVVVWDIRGNTVEECAVPHVGNTASIIGASSAADLAWLPGGDGWLLGGRCVFSRSLQRPIWEPSLSLGLSGGKIITEDQVVVMRQQGQEGLKLLTVRWNRDEIMRSVEQLESGAGLLAPGGAVSLDVRVGQVRFCKSAQAAQALRHAVSELLTAYDIRVLDDQEVVLRVRYFEEDAGILTLGGSSNVPPPQTKSSFDIYRELTNPFTPNREELIKQYESQGAIEVNDVYITIKGSATMPPAPSQTVQPSGGASMTQGNLKMSFTRKDSDFSLWKTERSIVSGYSHEHDEFSGPGLRKSMFNSMLFTISRCDMPYFIPSTPDTPCLPVVVDSMPDTPGADDQR